MASYFNIKTMNIEDIKEVFNARNQITHEMDIDMNSEYLNRRIRKKEIVKEYSDRIFKLARHYIQGVESKIPKKENSENGQ